MIIINDDYVIDTSLEQYTVRRVKGKDKKGNIVYQTIGYYSRLESAVSAIYKAMVLKKLSEKDYELKDAISEIKIIRNEINNKLQEVIYELQIHI